MRFLNPPTFPSAGLLSLRIAVGVTFLLHGLDKLGDLEALLFAASLALVLAGAGRFSLDEALDLRLRLPALRTRVTT